METKETGNSKKSYSFIIVPIMILLSIGIWISMGKYRTYLINNYATIEKKTEISGKVTKVILEHGIFCIDLSNGMRVKTMENVYNYKKSSMAGFLKEYDSIIKKVDSDTIIVKRYRKPYYFMLKN